MARAKSQQEAKVERLTWYALVVVLVVMLYFDRSLNAPPFVAPLVIAVIIIISSAYQQFAKHYRPSLISWSVAIALLVLGIYEIYYDLTFVDLRLAAIAAVVIVISFGVITNEG